MATKGRFTVSDEINEQNDWEYHCTLQDVTGLPIPLAAITTLTLTLYDVATGQIINGVNGTDIRNTGRGTIGDTDGSLRIHFYKADCPIVGSVGIDAKEAHIALIQCTYNGGASGWSREVYHKVTNRGKVT